MSITLNPNPPPSSPQSMDWFSWLSGTSLEPVLVYEYGLVLSQNELVAEDVAYFDHEFLQSMGIAVAKHRLEILKLARKGNGVPSVTPSVGETRPMPGGLRSALSRTRKSLGKYISRLVYHEDAGRKPPRDDFRKKDKDDIDMGVGDEIVLFRRKNNLAFSGPLVDSRVQDRFLITATANPKSTKWSGPLYQPPKSPVLPGHLYPNRSSKLSVPVLHPTRSLRESGPLERMAPSRGPKVVYGGDVDDFSAHSLWAQLFHDMKPT